MKLKVLCKDPKEWGLLSLKTLLIMKLTCVLLIAACLQVSAAGYSQKITLSQKNISLSKVFTEIRRQSGYLFLYNDKQVDNGKKVSIRVKDASIEDVLEKAFKDQSLTYTMVERTIVVMPREKVEFNDFYFTPLPPPIEIRGRVTNNNGEPLQNVSVLIAGTKIGTTTDSQGRFTLSAPEKKNMALEISSVGYQTKKVNVDQQLSEINIVLEQAASGLSDVVVIGYGTARKKDLTGAVSQVKTEELESTPVYNIGEALKGRSSGVQVTNNSGAPGSRIQVRIRGGNSMIGSNTPLYVVDGFPIVGDIDYLNASDIESINILKDASATAIYGSRGANGVVIITSKRGKAGQKGLISISSYYGRQEVAKRYKVLDAKQYATVANEWLKNSNLPPYFNVDTVKNPGTDWQDVIFRATPIQNHTITFAGSSEKTRYSLSGNYYGQEGIIINSGIKRGSFRINLDHDIKDWLSLAVNLNISRREQFSVPVDNGSRGNTVFTGALSAPPTAPVYDANGLPTRIETLYPFVDPTDMRNPLLRSEPWKDRLFANSVLQNTTLQAKIIKGLTLKTLLGLEYEMVNGESFVPIIFPNDKGSASTSQSYLNSFLNENTVTYARSFANSQNLDVTGGFMYQTNVNKNSGISVSGFPNNITENYNLAAATTTNPPSSGISKWTLASWLGRVNYSMKSKYYLTASIRADGSSRFGKDNKWGVFPSGALAWRVSEESFMQNVKFVSNLKLRGSYGITGNTALSPYQSLDRLSSVRYIDGGQAETIGYAPSGIANSKLRWETTAQLDLGFDLSIIDNRIDFTFDYYKKNTNNLLASVPLPPSVGFGSILQNIGEIQNSGVEFGVTADILNGPFKWNVSAQLSANRNKVIKLAGDKDIISTGEISGLSGYNIARVGLPLGMFYGYKEDGLDANGLIKYVDINNDGIINPLDRVIIGNPNPKFTFGFNSTFAYKNFDLNIFIEGVKGNNIFFQTGYTNLNSFQRGQNQLADFFGNYWTTEKPNPRAKYPKISAGTQMAASDRFIEDGSYLRIKTLQLGYNIPVRKMGAGFINKARIYVKANNLFTLTNYIGLDPDVNTTGNDSQSVGSRLSMGTDTDGYPNARIYAVGVQLDF
jgi:TonB-dependent starch-binding outer membrane protein SusC